MVHEGYDVTLYRTLAGVCKDAVATEFCVDDCRDDGSTPCTAAEIRKALKQDNIVRLYPLKGGDWKYRIQNTRAFGIDRIAPQNGVKLPRNPNRNAARRRACLQIFHIDQNDINQYLRRCR
jgi:hypothetical protein